VSRDVIHKCLDLPTRTSRATQSKLCMQSEWT